MRVLARCRSRYAGFFRRPKRLRLQSWKTALGIICAGATYQSFSLTTLAAGTQNSWQRPVSGLASWYGEELRGKPMANGGKFNPDNFTAASWYYPLGTQVLVTLR